LSYTTAAHEAVAGFADIADQGREGNKSKAVLCRLLYPLSYPGEPGAGFEPATY